MLRGRRGSFSCRRASLGRNGKRGFGRSSRDGAGSQGLGVWRVGQESNQRIDRASAYDHDLASMRT